MDRRWGLPIHGAYQKTIKGKNFMRIDNKYVAYRPWLKESIEELDFGKDER